MDKNIEIITPVREGIPGGRVRTSSMHSHSTSATTDLNIISATRRRRETERGVQTARTSPTWYRFIRASAMAERGPASLWQ